MNVEHSNVDVNMNDNDSSFESPHAQMAALMKSVSQPSADNLEVWTKIVELSEQHSSVDEIKRIYKGLLEQFPLCFGYWRRWAELELRLVGLDAMRLSKATFKTVIPALRVLVDGLGHLPACLDLWIQFLAILCGACPSYKSIDNEAVVSAEDLEAFPIISELLDTLAQRTVPPQIDANLELAGFPGTKSDYPSPRAFPDRPSNLVCATYSPLVRRAFEAALFAAGDDFHGAPLWDRYFAFERSQQEWVLASHVLFRLSHVCVPAAQSIIRNNLARLVTDSRADFPDVRALAVGFAQSGEHVAGSEAALLDKYSRTLEEQRAAKESAKPIVSASEAAADLEDGEMPSIDPAASLKKELEARQAIQGARQQCEFLVALREETWAQRFEATLANRRAHEAKVERPFFHVAPLREKETTNWRDYLSLITSTLLDAQESAGANPTPINKFVVSQAIVRVSTLYRRCLMTCALIPEFWQRFGLHLVLDAQCPLGAAVVLQAAASLPLVPGHLLAVARAEVLEAADRVLEAEAVLAEAQQLAVKFHLLNFSTSLSELLVKGDVRLALAKTGLLRRCGRSDDAKAALNQASDKCAERMHELHNAHAYARNVFNANNCLQLLSEAQLLLSQPSGHQALTASHHKILSASTASPDKFRNMQVLKQQHEEFMKSTSGEDSLRTIPVASLHRFRAESINDLWALSFEAAELEFQLSSALGGIGAQKGMDHLFGALSAVQGVAESDLHELKNSILPGRVMDSVVDWRAIAKIVEFIIRTTEPGPGQIARVEALFARVFGDRKLRRTGELASVLSPASMANLSARRVAFLKRSGAPLADVRNAEDAGLEALCVLDRSEVSEEAAAKRRKVLNQSDVIM